MSPPQGMSMLMAHWKRILAQFSIWTESNQTCKKNISTLSGTVYIKENKTLAVEYIKGGIYFVALL
jgi:hypothetical protein